MIDLPENWDLMDEMEQDSWFARFACFYSHDGEVRGLLPDVSEEVKAAWEAREASE